MPSEPPQSDPGRPTLAVALAAKGDVDLEPSLRALGSLPRAQRARVQLHVVHDQDRDWALEFERAGLPDAQLDPLGFRHTRVAPETSILKYWGLGLAAGDSEYVGVLDASCPPNEAWFRTALEQLQTGSDLFYGPVECSYELSDPRLVGYLVEYGHFAAPVPASGEYPGNNLVLRRAWLAPAEELAREGFFKTFMLWRLEAELSRRPACCPSLGVSYQKSFAPSAYPARRRDHGRCFAACRFEQDAQPPRWACILFTPLLGLVRSRRIHQRLRHNARLRRAFWRHSAKILLAECCWSWGEFLGYCFGDNGTCERLD